MTYLTYTNTYENPTDFEFNVDISIKTGEILEVANEEIECLTYVGETLEPVSNADKIIEFEVFYDPSDNDQKYILETETFISADQTFRSLSITFGKLEVFSIEKQKLFEEQNDNIVNFYI
jgi:hypothetical protein